MIPAIRAWYAEHKAKLNQGLLIFAVLCYIAREINIPLTKQWADSISFVIIGLVLIEIFDAVYKENKNTPFDEQAIAYSRIVEYIKTHGAKEAVLIQYSSTTCMEVIRELLRHRDCAVTVYIQHEDTAKKIGSMEQRNRIVDRCRNLHGELGNLFDMERLVVRKFRCPGSISAIRIDDKLLCMGWYIYEMVDEENQNPQYRKDSVQVSGHDISTMLVWRGTNDYDALNRTFSMLEANYRRNAEPALEFAGSPRKSTVADWGLKATTGRSGTRDP